MILIRLTSLLVNTRKTSKKVNDSKTAENKKIAALLFFFFFTFVKHFLSDVWFDLSADTVEVFVKKHGWKSQSYLVNALIEEITERLILEVGDGEDGGDGSVEKDGLFD